jgi:Lsr2
VRVELLGSLTSGRLRFALGELSSVPRAAIVVEDRYSQIFAIKHIRPAVICDGLAELQVRWPAVPLVFCETRKLAEEWTYRYLAAACTWAEEEPHALERVTPAARPAPATPAATSSSTAEIRAWAQQHGLEVADRGRLRPEVLAAFRSAQP